MANQSTGTDPLARALDDRLRRVTERLASASLAVSPQVATSLPDVCVASEFVLQVLLADPGRLLARVGETLGSTAPLVTMQAEIAARPESEGMAMLRRFRQVEMARIAWRDLAGWSDIETTLRELSDLADGLIRASLEYAADSMEPRFGRPLDAAGRTAPLLVLGMGKLGGRELNFSSDVDLVFLYPDAATLTGIDADDVEDYFRRLALALIRLLDQVTEHGFVFRVDTRLRPFGASGPLAISIAAFEAYLVQHGRDWERYAYVKARLITGDEYRSEVFDEILTPFVYRRYLDYGVFDALRTMKRLISKEVARKDMQDNLKLGPGGIREVEFIAQALQIVRGGHVPALRTASLLSALPLLVEHKQLTPEACDALRSAYLYLRTVENRLQSMDDRQTHDLPGDDEQRARLANAMGLESWTALRAAVDSHRAAIEAEFNRIAWDTDDPNGAPESFKAAWESGTFVEALRQTALGDEVIDLLTGFRQSGLYRRMDELGRQRLAAVIARTIPLLEQHASPAVTLGRVLPIYQAICRRSAYLSLLDENRMALDRLLTVAAQSPLLARQIAEHPLLLDELLDARLFDAAPTREELARSLRQHVKNTDHGDIEALLDAMRQFQRAAIFRIAIADRLSGLPIMKVSDRLTDTAELVLEFALDIARGELESKHGKPICGDADERREAGFAVVGYGKLGGLELGYGSDLDLVFLHDSEGTHQETDGANVIENARFFARLVQRLIHFLTIQTSSGRLYEVDTRLRPSGGSGLMVASLENFRRYQREEAWTWEHQALLRSRAVAGTARLRAVFEEERRDILINHVDRSSLKVDVRQMRLRMRKELSKGGKRSFDLKQDPGGLADIEFLVNYWVLASAGDCPELVTFPDNVRQLEALERAGLVPREYCRGLKDAYLKLRQRIHELALGEADRLVDDEEFADLRDWVKDRWNEVFGADAEA